MDRALVLETQTCLTLCVCGVGENTLRLLPLTVKNLDFLQILASRNLEFPGTVPYSTGQNFLTFWKLCPIL